MGTSTFSQARPERWFYALIALGLAVVLVGLGAAHWMEVEGHVVTGMNNQVVWGLPHVFAIFLIVAGAGVLNVASVGSVFGQQMYKKRAPLSAVLSVALLAGGLMVLVLDLGRPERVIVAATHYNFTSVFAWNMILYNGMFAIVAVYLWTMFERRYNHLTQAVGIAALVWRIALTTGTGSIFGFLVARQAYQSALLAPLFIVLSLSWGLAVFMLAQAALYAWSGQQIDAAVRARLLRLLGVFLAAGFYLVLVYHMTNLYFAKQTEFELFILLGRDGGAVFAALFWLGYVVLGAVLPMVLAFHPRFASERSSVVASLLVLLGAFAWLYVFIIGGQVFPLEIFPGYAVRSGFGDGAVASYTPRWPEWLLGLGGLGVAFVLSSIGVRVLDVFPHDDATSGGARP